MLLVVICALGTCLNIIAISYNIQRQKFRKPYDVAYLNLGSADLLFSLVGLLFYGIFLCLKSENSLAVHCWIVDILVGQYFQLVDAIAVLPIVFDRLIAVLRPLKYKQNTVYLWVITFTWTLPALWLTINFCVVYKGRLYPKISKAAQSKADVFYSIEATFFYFLPTIFNIICFLLIIRSLMTSRHKTRVYVNVAKAVLTIVIFCASWIPSIVGRYTINDDMEHAYFYYPFSRFFWLNTVADPFLYLIPTHCIVHLLRSVEIKPEKFHVRYIKSL